LGLRKGEGGVCVEIILRHDFELHKIGILSNQRNDIEGKSGTFEMGENDGDTQMQNATQTSGHNAVVKGSLQAEGKVGKREALEACRN
jgi:hypothetical protein